MAIINTENKKILSGDISNFEKEHNLNISSEYKDFLLIYNGGEVSPNVFRISNEEGESAVNILYGLNISDEYDELSNIYETMEGEISEEFIAIGDDSAGNQICLGVNGEYKRKVYLWMHDMEDDGDMSNMFLLASNFSEFLDNLYEDNDN